MASKSHETFKFFILFTEETRPFRWYSYSISRSNWNLRMLISEGKRKPENSGKIARRKARTNSGHINGRRVRLPLHQPSSASVFKWNNNMEKKKKVVELEQFFSLVNTKWNKHKFPRTVFNLEVKSFKVNMHLYLPPFGWRVTVKDWPFSDSIVMVVMVVMLVILPFLTRKPWQE